jgi:hypothetical protein
MFNVKSLPGRAKTMVLGKRKFLLIALLVLIVCAALALFLVLQTRAHIPVVEDALANTVGANATQVAAQGSNDSQADEAADKANDDNAKTDKAVGDNSAVKAMSTGSVANDDKGSTSKHGGSSSSAGSDSDNGGSGNSSSDKNDNGVTAPTDPNAGKTWVKPWDEYVKDGYYKTTEHPAEYGYRDVYGSVCNDCGANITGHAMQHLKETHHSGYHEGVVGKEKYLIKDAWTEKVWVDTSHWVHHDGYWK